MSRIRRIPTLAALAALGALGAGVAAVMAPSLAHATFSIVAHDPATGRLGVAVQSHWFSVGSVVTWAEAGVGAVATQSFVDPAYGLRGLDLMRSGLSPEQALAALTAVDEGRDDTSPSAPRPLPDGAYSRYSSASRTASRTAGLG